MKKNLLRFLKVLLTEKRYLILRKKFLSLFKQMKHEKVEDKEKLFAMYYNTLPVDKNVVLYESYNGVGMICNPYAIFKKFLLMPDFNKYTHIWVISSKAEQKLLKKEYIDYRNIKFVFYGSAEYIKVLASAGYIINNVSFPFYFAKKPEQCLVNTWHSITVKTLGFDIPDGSIASRNVLRSFLMSDYILSANAFMTKIFTNSYKLNDVYRGKILEIGHPRNDALFTTQRGDIFAKLETRGTKLDQNKKIILYAPTWKGSSLNNPQVDIDAYKNFITSLSEYLENDMYQVIVKPHQAVYKKLDKKDKEGGRYISASIDTNELLSVVDILISDYSSIYFDFLVTDRPVLFFIPDIDNYNEYRGLYFSLEELPGPATKEVAELGKWINNIGEIQKQYQDKYNATKSWACQNDNGEVSTKAVDCIFKYNVSQANVISNFDSSKCKLIFYGSSLATNGVTATLVSLLNLIDYSRYDVSLYLLDHVLSETKENLGQINDNVRIIFRCGKSPFTVEEEILKKHLIEDGIEKNTYSSLEVVRMYEREYIRNFGSAEFDYFIDYSGYGLTIPLVFLHKTSIKKIVWQHSDFVNDLNNAEKRSINKYKNMITSEQLKTLYEYADKIVGCSRDVMLRNREFLSTPKTFNRFTFVTNAINYVRVKEGVKKANFISPFHYVDKNPSDKKQWVGKYIVLPEDPENRIVFVTMGRFSPEKNHMELLRAFNRICHEYKDCYLYIIGDGELRKTYEGFIADNKLMNNVVLLNSLKNPFGLMKEFDCFILPSLYEGYATVIPEARIVGLPIIIANYPTATSSFCGEFQIVVEPTETGLYTGMSRFLDGHIPLFQEFNAQQHNQNTYNQFEQLFLDFFDTKTQIR